MQKLQKEGEAGRKKIIQYTRYGTVALAAAQSLGVSFFLESLQSPSTGLPVVLYSGWSFRLLTVLTITAGTVFIMWLGEQIDAHGIGNGMSLLIFIGIIAALPFVVRQEYRDFVTNDKAILIEIAVLVIVVALTALVVLITQGHAQNSGTIRQARGRAARLWRAKHAHPAQSQYVWRDAHYFCTGHYVFARDNGRVCPEQRIYAKFRVCIYAEYVGGCRCPIGRFTPCS